MPGSLAPPPGWIVGTAVRGGSYCTEEDVAFPLTPSTEVLTVGTVSDVPAHLLPSVW